MNSPTQSALLPDCEARQWVLDYVARIERSLGVGPEISPVFWQQLAAALLRVDSCGRPMLTVGDVDRIVAWILRKIPATEKRRRAGTFVRLVKAQANRRGVVYWSWLPRTSGPIS
jgi:hypothetical protein